MKLKSLMTLLFLIMNITFLNAKDTKITTDDNGLLKSTTYTDTNGYEFYNETVYNDSVLGLKIQKEERVKTHILKDWKKIHVTQTFEGQNKWRIDYNQDSIQYLFWWIDASYRTTDEYGYECVYANGQYEAWFTYFNYTNGTRSCIPHWENTNYITETPIVYPYVIKIVCHNNSYIVAYVGPEKQLDFALNRGGSSKIPLNQYYFVKGYNKKWTSYSPQYNSVTGKYNSIPKVISEFINKLNNGETNITIPTTINGINRPPPTSLEIPHPHYN